MICDHSRKKDVILVESRCHGFLGGIRHGKVLSLGGLRYLRYASIRLSVRLPYGYELRCQ